jgi:hypothetical protein
MHGACQIAANCPHPLRRGTPVRGNNSLTLRHTFLFSKSWRNVCLWSLLPYCPLNPAHIELPCLLACASFVTYDSSVCLSSPAVRKKPDAAEREGMPMTVSKLCYETQLIARPKDPSE